MEKMDYIVELGDCEKVAEYGVEILQNPTLHKQIVDRSLCDYTGSI